MATFPALVPASRTFTPGEYLHTALAAYRRSQSRVRQNNVMVASTLRATFVGLTAAQVTTIVQHFIGQQGPYRSFVLPADIWDGTADSSDFTLSGYFWRYNAEPIIEDLPLDRHNVEIELITAAPESQVIGAQRWLATVAWAPGVAQGSASGAGDALGAAWTAGATWALVPPNGTAAAANQLVLASWAPGNAYEAFDPLSLSPLRWYDASDSGTVTTSSSAVTDWDDKSGNAAHLTQATSAERPTYATAEVNGLNAIDWGSAANGKSLRNGTNVTVREVWVVCRGDFTGSTFPDFIGLFNPGTDTSNIMLTGVSGGTGMSTQRTFSLYLNGNHSTDTKSDVIPEIQSPCLLRQVFDSSESTASGISVGLDRNYNTLNRGWQGVICEVFAFTSALSAGDASDLATHLLDKWGIA